jgi:hypothetical protein
MPSVPPCCLLALSALRMMVEQVVYAQHGHPPQPSQLLIRQKGASYHQLASSRPRPRELMEQGMGMHGGPVQAMTAPLVRSLPRTRVSCLGVLPSPDLVFECLRPGAFTLEELNECNAYPADDISRGGRVASFLPMILVGH